MTKRHVDRRRIHGVLQERRVVLDTRAGVVMDSDWRKVRKKYDKHGRVRKAGHPVTAK